MLNYKIKEFIFKYIFHPLLYLILQETINKTEIIVACYHVRNVTTIYVAYFSHNIYKTRYNQSLFNQSKIFLSFKIWNISTYRFINVF